MSTWIRDVLNPHIDRDDRDVLDHDTLRRLRTFFTALKSTPIGIEDIRYSHIDRALIKICDVQTKWPVDLVKRAEEVLQALEQSVGPLRKLKVDTLSAHGPHLEGEVKRGGRLEKVLVHVAQDDHKSRKNNWTATCDNPERAYAFGHIGFEVGE